MTCSIATASAALVLAMAHECPWGQFEAGYGPFLDLIPLESLGPGLAPEVTSFPTTRFGRFATRLRAMFDSDWNGIVEIAIVRDVAVGRAEVDRVSARAWEVLKELVDAGEPDFVTEMAAAMDHLELAGVFSDSGEAHRLMFRSIGAATEREQAHWDARAIAIEQRALRLLKGDALVALAVEPQIGAQMSALLYLPFCSAVPVSSLVFGSP